MTHADFEVFMVVLGVLVVTFVLAPFAYAWAFTAVFL